MRFTSRACPSPPPLAMASSRHGEVFMCVQNVTQCRQLDASLAAVLRLTWPCTKVTRRRHESASAESSRGRRAWRELSSCSPRSISSAVSAACSAFAPVRRPSTLSAARAARTRVACSVRWPTPPSAAAPHAILSAGSGMSTQSSSRADGS